MFFGHLLQISGWLCFWCFQRSDCRDNCWNNQSCPWSWEWNCLCKSEKFKKQWHFGDDFKCFKNPAVNIEMRKTLICVILKILANYCLVYSQFYFSLKTVLLWRLFYYEDYFVMRTVLLFRPPANKNLSVTVTPKRSTKILELLNRTRLVLTSPSQCLSSCVR